MSQDSTPKHQRRSWFFSKPKKNKESGESIISGSGLVNAPNSGYNSSTESEIAEMKPRDDAVRKEPTVFPNPIDDSSITNSPMIQHPPDNYSGIESSSSKKKSSLKKALSSTVPILSWLRTGQTKNVINPLLHLATAALNAETETSIGSEGTQSTIHQVLSDYPPAEELWSHPDEESSIESFNSLDEVGFRQSESDSSENALAKTKVDESANNSTEDLPQPKVPELSIEEKLQKVFELPGKEGYITEFACWFVKSVLLKGYMYLTEHHLCFYAQLPPVTSDQVKLQGYLQKKTRRSPKKTYSKYWFVLKSDGLNIYSDASKPYFPSTTIYLKNVIQVRPSSSKNGIKVKTTSKTYHFKADSDVQMREWIDAINSAVLHSKHSDNDIIVVLPYSSIADISVVSTEFHCDALKITTVYEDIIKPEEYFFSYFNDIQNAFEILNDCWLQAKGTAVVAKRAGRLLHRKSSELTTGMTPSTSMPDVSYQLPPKLEKKPSIVVASTDKSMESVFTGTTSPEPDLQIDNSNGPRPSDVSDKRKSWFTHRKSMSDDGILSISEDLEKKENDFKTYFAISESEKLVYSIRS